MGISGKQTKVNKFSLIGVSLPNCCRRNRYNEGGRNGFKIYTLTYLWFTFISVWETLFSL